MRLSFTNDRWRSAMRVFPSHPLTVASEGATSGLSPILSRVLSLFVQAVHISPPLPHSLHSTPPPRLFCTPQARIEQGNLLKKLVDGIKDLVRCHDMIQCMTLCDTPPTPLPELKKGQHFLFQNVCREGTHCRGPCGKTPLTSGAEVLSGAGVQQSPQGQCGPLSRLRLKTQAVLDHLRQQA